ncbi:glycerol-3-phosphate 1-O-acyltransferase PlsB [Gallaecimonas kandeliae]|uniref:glycerol-3-phosphate 1-O-acyltransferase PlsB n=1 Tax=Gallaecimonas kandeliae TaxID=3029055 RepID=UPI002649CF75|nr:glycerol-3-phosphate 1-O-acyltransferase PlsB [Gallaecimonas kandeliae]WKE65832.1 glycerol-3-phosphate 1-O-acyltransferase PlsB [Gallaecimonas kandeliae]
MLPNFLLKALKWPISLSVKSKLVPQDPIKELQLDPAKPIVYAFKTASASDLLAVRRLCFQLGLPDPTEPLRLNGEILPRSLFLDRPVALLTRSRKSGNFRTDLAKLLDALNTDEHQEIQLLPISLFWGRQPGHENPSLLGSMLSDYDSPSWLRKALIIARYGRDNFVRFARPVSLRTLLADRPNASLDELGHKLARVARVHFSRQRLVMTGPRLPDRETMLAALLKTEPMKRAIEDEAKGRKEAYGQAEKRAAQYLDEIAAKFSPGFVRILDRLLTWIWNRIYNGIQVTNAEVVRQLAHDGHEIVYVPCHRSHMDYLLLSYVIYQQGMVPPHIAAGVNLNFFPAGPMFRRGGAFFIRRSFKGNKLYSTVFREYLYSLFEKGYAVEYFTEGGRSRTGRLLPPKTGMLAMTVQSMLRKAERPITLVPVYIGYEHVMEVGSYLKELRGNSKEKESGWQAFKSSIQALRQDFGQGFVNFGQPIPLTQYLGEQVPDWRQASESPDAKPSWLTPLVNKLGDEVLTRINDAAALNGTTLTALALLSAEHRALTREVLEAQLDLLLALAKAAPYSAQMTVPELDGKALLAQTLKGDKFLVSQDGLGELVSLDEHRAIAMTYYRNNILHLYVLPALVAKLLLGQSFSSQQLKDKVRALYPLLKAELFMGLDEAQLDAYLDQILAGLAAQELISGDEAGWQAMDARRPGHRKLWLLAGVISESLQRYAIVLTLLRSPEPLGRAELESRAQAVAERLSALYGINAPEFFDKKLIATLIATLREADLVELGEQSELLPNQAAAELDELVLGMLDAEVADTIRNLLCKEGCAQ